MPRQANTFVENSFVKGLITEATGLNFPEQAVSETNNCVFDEKGIVRRRRGIDYEWGYQLNSIFSERVKTTFLWEAAAGDGNNTILVQQVGARIYFFLVDGAAASNNRFDFIQINDFLPSGSSEDPGLFECQYAAGKGFLFVANPVLESFYVTYDSAAQSVSGTQISLTIRDFEGVDDDLRDTERPASLTQTHQYNLLNQSWDSDEVNRSGGGSEKPLSGWDADRGDYPSNCDVWWFYNGGTAPADWSQLSGYFPTPAPKGHFVLDYYNQDRNNVDTDMDMSVLPNPTFTTLSSTSAGDKRASTIEFFAGRVWYAGVDGTGYSNRILFSQVIERDAQIGKCHQLNDPTAQDNFDLLATDGGTLTILDSGRILKLFAFEDSILVFASNGVWRISGSEGVGFRATDYSVVKVSSIPVLTASSFVSVAGVPCFWNSEGIYTLQADQVSGSPSIVSLTDTTIKQFIDGVPYESKRFVKGCYNRATRIVTWVYASEAPTNLEEQYTFDSILNLNTLTGAFYGWTVDTSAVEVHGVFVVLSDRNVASPETVTNSALATVTDSSLATVVAFSGTIDSIQADVTKFVVSAANGSDLTFAEEWSDTYLDWYSADNVGKAYTSSFTTGYKIHGDGLRKPQPSYINLFFKTDTYDNQIDFRSLWQYANTGSTGRWSTAQRIVTTSNDYDYTRRRIKSRGSGVVYQFNVTSVAGQPFFLIGWSVFETQTGGV